jgi:hypothetical protein
MQRLFILFLLFLVVWACANDATSKMKPLDLLPYGVPMSIKVPLDSPQIKTGDGFLGEKEVILKAGEGFDLLITYEPARTSDIAKLKSEQVSNVKEISNFSKMMREEEKGFIYETQVDSTHYYYGFRYVHLQGSQFYLFQSGLIGTFTLEQAEAMYNAVQQK